MLPAGGEFLHVRGHINASAACVKHFQIISRDRSQRHSLPSSLLGSGEEVDSAHGSGASDQNRPRGSAGRPRRGTAEGDGRGGRVSQTRGDREFKQGGKAKTARERK